MPSNEAAEAVAVQPAKPEPEPPDNVTQDSFCSGAFRHGLRGSKRAATKPSTDNQGFPRHQLLPDPSASMSTSSYRAAATSFQMPAAAPAAAPSADAAPPIQAHDGGANSAPAFSLLDTAAAGHNVQTSRKRRSGALAASPPAAVITESKGKLFKKHRTGKQGKMGNSQTVPARWHKVVNP